MNRQKVLSEGIRAILGGNLVAALVKLGILFRDHHFSLHELRTSGE
jgi:hypothetical protein